MRQDHELVTTGIYTHIRHPMYAAHLLWAVAQPLLLHNWLAGPGALVFFVPFLLIRISREELTMLDAFGQEYRAYVNRTGRLIPPLQGWQEP
jgi:protein-S-isoprenylcysteine O-methyltransferase Ste14